MRIDLLSADTVAETMRHAIEVALHAPHKAVGGVWRDLCGEADLGADDKSLTPHGEQRYALWKDTFDRIEAHQPG